MTNWDRLILDIVTDGTISPKEAFVIANNILIEQFSALSGEKKEALKEEEKEVELKSEKAETPKEKKEEDDKKTEDKEDVKKTKKRGRPKKE